MARIRFCAYEYAHRPISELIESWKRAEALGFDVLWNCDAMNEPDSPGRTMFEATSILTAMALHTSTIRVGTLVNTLIYRNPAVVAKAAMTIDHLSGGRLELGYGGGVLRSDHEASGVDWFEPRERIERFREAVTIVDGMLTHGVFTFEGVYHAARAAEMEPLPIQRPRPPLTIPAHGPGMMRIAAEFADGWSSWGGYQIDTEMQMFEVTRDRSARFDDFCVDAGRDPKTIRHSLVVFPRFIPGIRWVHSQTWSVATARSGSTSSFSTSRRTGEMLPMRRPCSSRSRAMSSLECGVRRPLELEGQEPLRWGTRGPCGRQSFGGSGGPTNS